jgi:hypothetical protein
VRGALAHSGRPQRLKDLFLISVIDMGGGGGILAPMK